MVPECNICDSTQKVKIYDATLKLYQCFQCEHTFTLIDETYHQESIYSETYFDSSHQNWFKYPNYPLFAEIHKIVINYFKKRDFKLIDVGCGRGDMLSYLRKMEKDADLHGIDNSMISSPDFKFFQADFMKIDLKEKFDCITSVMCIEHIENPKFFVQKLNKMLQPQGLLIITTINSGGILYGLARFLNKIGIKSSYNRLYSEHHVHHFTNPSLRLLLEKNGFKIISQKNHNYRLESVDYPSANPLMTLLYKTAIACIFFISTICNTGVAQTVVCAPDKRSL